MQIVFNNCKYLETINIWCDNIYGKYLTDQEALEAVVKCSPKNVCELKLVYVYDSLLRSQLLPNHLESFLISWKNRIPKKPLSMTVPTLLSDPNFLMTSVARVFEDVEIAEKYIELGVIKEYIDI